MFSAIAIIGAIMSELHNDHAEVRATLGNDFQSVVTTAASIADIIDTDPHRQAATAILDDLVLDCAERGGSTEEGSTINNSGIPAQLAYLFSYNGHRTVEILRDAFADQLPGETLDRHPFGSAS